MKISSRILPGPLAAGNRCADWGWQGLLAYGSQNLVVVVEPRTVQVFQTLEHHKHTVTKVKWCYENYHHSLASPYGLRLASSDSSGQVVVWDVSEATIRAEFSENSKPILDMEWLSYQDSVRDFLAILHPSSVLVLWNADTGTKVWKKNLSETLVSFSIDPFDKKHLAVLSQDCLLFVDEFSSARVPSSAPRKFYIASSTSAAVGARQRSAMKRVRQLVGDSKKSDEPTSFNDCLQMCYSPACRHHLFLLYPREILLLDLQIYQTIGVVPLERNGSAFQQITACRQRDVLFCLHDNGCVSMRIRRKYHLKDLSSSTQVSSLLTSQNLDVVYDLRCQSDALRLSKHNKVVRMCVNPVDERTVALVLSDGRVLFWQLLASQRLMPVSVVGLSDPCLVPPLSPPSQAVDGTVNGGASLLRRPSSSLSLADLFGPQSFPGVSKLQPLGNSLSYVTLKLVLNGLLQTVAAPPLCLRMCPPLTTKNFTIYEPLLAAGTSNGNIQVFNLESAHLHREFTVHTSPVRGMDWLDMHRLLSFSYPSVSGAALVRNELKMVHVKSGICTTVRFSKEDEPTMEAVKVSFSRQYFAVLIKDRPLELWDCTHVTLLREMSGDFPVPVVMEWSPMHLPKSLARHGRAAMASAGMNEAKVLGREHFVMTDSTNTLLHYILEGSAVKEAVKISLEGMGTVTYMAWKGDVLVIGDLDGQVSFWDLKKKVSKNVMAHRSAVKKIRFAPGKGNALMGVLYSNGHFDIVASHTSDIIASLKTIRAHDFEFAASDKPTIACSTGCIRVMDYKLQNSMCPVSASVQMEPVFCPRVLLGKAGLLLKSVLQHQPWRDSYSFDADVFPRAEDPDESPVETAASDQFKTLPQSLKSSLADTSLGVAHRCLLTAKLFGDEYEASFWEVALYYLIQQKERRKDPNYKSVLEAEPINPTTDIFSPQRDAKTSVGNRDDLVGALGSPAATASNSTELKPLECVASAPSGAPSLETTFMLDACHDVLVESADFQHLQLYRVALHDSKRSTYDHTQKCAAELIYLKQTDRVVQLLLETDAENDQYYSDALRACLVATIRSSGASQSTIKLVATNLIANGRLSEGVQLLCLIDKGIDACRYLQSYEEWEQAAWLAKATLSERDCAEVFLRWADHLSSPPASKKHKAVLIYLSFGLFHKVLETLYSMRQFDLAAMFAEACLEFKVVDESSDLNSLIEAIFLEYARYLHSLGSRQGAINYCSKAGENGSQLLRNEIQINATNVDTDEHTSNPEDSSAETDSSTSASLV